MFANLLGGGEDDAYQNAGGDQASLFDQARISLGMQPSMREQMADSICPQMSFKARLFGFASCFVIGCLISLSSLFSFTQLLHGRPAAFAIKYTLGNIVAILSTAFLVGPSTQLKRMTSPVRWGAALVYVISMTATLVVALAVHCTQTARPTLLLTTHAAPCICRCVSRE